MFTRSPRCSPTRSQGTPCGWHRSLCSFAFPCGPPHPRCHLPTPPTIQPRKTWRHRGFSLCVRATKHLTLSACWRRSLVECGFWRLWSIRFVFHPPARAACPLHAQTPNSPVTLRPPRCLGVTARRWLWLCHSRTVTAGASTRAFLIIALGVWLFGCVLFRAFFVVNGGRPRSVEHPRTARATTHSGNSQQAASKRHRASSGLVGSTGGPTSNPGDKLRHHLTPECLCAAVEERGGARCQGPCKSEQGARWVFCVHTGAFPHSRFRHLSAVPASVVCVALSLDPCFFGVLRFLVAADGGATPPQWVLACPSSRLECPPFLPTAVRFCLLCRDTLAKRKSKVAAPVFFRRNAKAQTTRRRVPVCPARAGTTIGPAKAR